MRTMSGQSRRAAAVPPAAALHPDTGRPAAAADVAYRGACTEGSGTPPDEAGRGGALSRLLRGFSTFDARPAVARARAIGKDHDPKKVDDDGTGRALFPSNHPPAA